MVEPIILKNRIRQVLDETCEKIIMIMMYYRIYERDKRRYNELYRLVNGPLKISKPTFNDHIEHLIKKKLVKRSRMGKQCSFLFLNRDNLMVHNAKEILEKIKEDWMVLSQAMNKEGFWENLPEVFSMHFALCGLRRLQIILRYMLKPEKAYENILELSVLAHTEDSVMHDLAGAILNFKPKEERQRKLELTLTAIDKAMEEVKPKMARHMEKEK